MKTKERHHGEYIGGPEAIIRFDAVVEQTLSVTRSVLERRERAYKKQSEAKAVRPGPKRKRAKASASGRASRAKD